MRLLAFSHMTCIHDPLVADSDFRSLVGTTLCYTSNDIVICMVGDIHSENAQVHIVVSLLL